MSRYVVDASVAAKWFVPEIYSEAALRLREGSHELLAPDLIVPQLGNALWKKIRRAELTRTEAREILRTLSRLPLMYHPSGPLIGSALDLAVALQRTVYDALYLALALLRGCQTVTADRPFHAAVQRSPYAPHVLWVEDIP